MKKKYLIYLIIILILLVPIGITFSKYLKQIISNYIFEANNFYFNSDKLKYGGKEYHINNWSGVDPFVIQFDLNNMKNNILSSTSDIAYNLSVTCDTDTTCSLNSTSGTIMTTEKIDNLVLTITPSRTFLVNEEIEITVTANSLSPYQKTLRATFVIKVGTQGISYEIDDEVDSPYLNFGITNARSSYVVDTAFGTYSVGDEITSAVYTALSAENKAKCSSATITLAFDPAVVVLDTTSNITTNSTKLYTTVNNVSYISSITFKINALSSTSIRFYKKNASNDYTYPFVNQTSIISFTAV